MLIKNILIISLLVCVGSCIEKIDFKIEDSGLKQLVVEGNINDTDGSYFVYLSYASANVVNENKSLEKEPVSGAIVTIVHVSSGNAIELLELNDEYGTYSSGDNPAFIGIDNNEYFLQVEMQGETYQSTIEIIKTAPPLDSVYIEFNEESRKIEVFIDFTDPPETRDAYLWKWKGFRQIRTVLPPIGGGTIENPGPGDADTVSCCAICYIPFTGNELNVSEDTHQNGQKIERQKITSFHIIRPNNFLVEVQQHKLSEEAFNFWNLLQLQQESQGGLFDPPPFRIVGNMRNINRREEVVLGYFYASGVTEIQLQFSGNEFALSSSPFEGTQNDCRLIQLADTLQPINWQ